VTCNVDEKPFYDQGGSRENLVVGLQKAFGTNFEGTAVHCEQPYFNSNTHEQ